MKRFLKENKIKTAHNSAVFFDKLAGFVIHLGGVAVIIAVIGILVFIVWEAIPLMFQATSQKEVVIKQKKFDGIPLLTGIDEYQELIYVVTDSATVEFINLKNNNLKQKVSFPQLKKFHAYSAFSSIDGNNLVLGLDSGWVVTLSLKFESHFNQSSKRTITPQLSFGQLIRLDSSTCPITKVTFAIDEDGQITIAGLCDSKLILYQQSIESSLFNGGDTTIFFKDLTNLFEGEVFDFTVGAIGERFVVADNAGYIYDFDLREKGKEELVNRVKVISDESNRITALTFLLGNQSVIVGDKKGNISSWMRINSDSGLKFVNNHIFHPVGSAITSISSSNRNKSFLIGTANGTFQLSYLTSERVLLKNDDDKIPIRYITFAPKSNGAVILYKNGLIVNYKIDNPHPEVSWKSLFGKVWYEGYQKPEYVWQSTGGTDEFEPKLSLIPLIIGTLKGTFYAMLFAIPLALLGALYTSTFIHPSLRNKIKPTVELMAALPSVVIGFLAGLWLAPVLEELFPAFILSFIVLPMTVVFGHYLWSHFPKLRFGLKEGYEILFFIPLLLLGFFISIKFGPYFQSILFGGDYRHWLSEYLDMHYDQRNSLVVGFAMGFAVIPIIFTICEDSLSSVPQHLSSASLALGANKWQTAIRVVLPTASPGIFSAIMIGFGRAIGETMIVLMATGNTPILSFSPFNGMRTLSANIAVEIPEAPYHGTLYRVLFVSAALLFLLTFIVNTVAEIVRQRLRKKYMHI